MGFTAFCLSHVFFALATKDEQRSIFNMDLLEDRPLMLCSGLSVLVIYLTTSFGPFQRLAATTELDLTQWLICIAAALLVLIASEIRKLVLRRPIDATAGEEEMAAEATAVVTP